MKKSNRSFFMVMILISLAVLGFTWHKNTLKQNEILSLHDSIYVLKEDYDSVSARLNQVEELFVFDRVQVFPDQPLKRVRLGETIEFRIGLLASTSGNNELAKRHRIIYWFKSNQMHKDTLDVETFMTRIRIQPQSNLDTSIVGVYQIVHNDELIGIPFELDFSVHK